MVYRIFVEKKPGLDNEARALKSELIELLGIKGITGVRQLIRYDVENISRDLFLKSVKTVFSEPQLDMTSEDLPENLGSVFAVEYLPGQFDQRADSAAQCIQIISCAERPVIKTARVYGIKGSISKEDISAIKKYVINPVEAREASLEKPETLTEKYDVPDKVKIIKGFRNMNRSAVSKFISDYGLAMDEADLEFCRNYFVSEKRDPTITEIRMIDTYWSDHCRHTTFNTTIDSVIIGCEEIRCAYDLYEDTRKTIGRTKPSNLMDIGTLAAKYLKKQGLLDKLDESDEINACTVKISVEVDGV